jgi:hypothetical protein
MSNGLDLLVFRLIHTVLYRCRLLEYTLVTTKPVIVCDIYGALPAKSHLRQLLEYGLERRSLSSSERSLSNE